MRREAGEKTGLVDGMPRSRSLPSGFLGLAPGVADWASTFPRRFMLHASYPRSVTFTQLRFTLFAVINLRRDLHPQECALAGRTKKSPESLRAFQDKALAAVFTFACGASFPSRASRGLQALATPVPGLDQDGSPHCPSQRRHRSCRKRRKRNDRPARKPD